jgi:hypothetical protein
MRPILRIMLVAPLLWPFPGWALPVDAPGGAARGERLFDGREPVAATLAGHTASLPPQLAACIACHGGAAAPSSLEVRVAPPLGCTLLSRRHDKQGEPPLLYERESFCRTVRTGSNPNYVMLGREMPRFDLSQAQCDALWIYLTTRGTDCHDQR